jgi:transposase
MGLNRCKLSEKVQERLLEMFVAQVTARTAADLVGVNYHTVHLFYHKIRLLIAEKVFDDELLAGEFELDESYFGGVRKGKKGRGAAGKNIVFGLLKRGGKVFALPVGDVKTNTLMPIICSKIAPDSVVYTDSFRSYNALDVSGFKHHRINHKHEFAKGRNHINGIENFWNQSKRILRKYNGIPKDNFPLFLQECVFRFNFGSPLCQLNVLKLWANMG